MSTRVEEVFERVVAEATPEARRARIAELCAGDDLLIGQVQRLLRAHDRAGGFLGAATSDHLDGVKPRSLKFPGVGDATPEIEGVGATIGRYRLLQLIGEGGFGRVFMAEQTEPVVRKVAVKVVKPGMDTGQILARFEAERQALAMMDHDGIARVFDAGATAGGRPYFVMELVAGEPITQFCDDNALTVRQRLELFRRVCAAVQHAHQKGVIHRDIKPSNILVVERDGRPDPKVIDFGISKAVSGRLTERTVFTEFRQFIGTPAYMSPEQCRGGGLDIDTRSDVYSLGVVLYELLTGTTPIEQNALHQASLDEMTEMIRNAATPRPSTRISGSTEAREIASKRGVEPGRLGTLLKGDLDWIVLKALDKDRSRRYETAVALADDVSRFLAHEPVTATPPSAAYRMRKFVARNRGAVLAGGLVLAAVVAGLAGTTAGLVWALEERDRADQQARNAQHEAARASQTAAFLKSMLESASPFAASGDDPTLLRRIAQNALAELDADDDRDPLLDAELRHTIGLVLNHTGDLERSEELFRQAYGERRTVLGPTHPDTIASQTYLGVAILDLGRLDEASGVIEEAVDAARQGLVAPNPATAEAIDSLVRIRTVQGRYEEAEPLARESVEIWTESVGPEHQLTLLARTSLAVILHSRGRSADAVAIYQEILPILRRTVGTGHPATISAMSSLGIALAEGQGRLDESLALLSEAADATRQTFGTDHPATINRLSNLGQTLTMLDRLEEAERFQREAYEAGLRRFGPMHEMSLFPGSLLAGTLVRLNRIEDAIEIYDHVVPGMAQLLGPDHQDTLVTLAGQGNALRLAGRLEEADPILRRAVDGLRASLGVEHTLTGLAMRRRTLLLIDQHRFSEAQAQLSEAYEAATRARPDHAPEQAALIGNMVMLHEAWHAAEPGSGHDAEAARWRERAAPPE